jgi:hypothetical protein
MHTPWIAVQAPSALQLEDCRQSSFVSAAQRPAMLPHLPWLAQAADPLQSPSWATHTPASARH